jgi:hypothetical protein
MFAEISTDIISRGKKYFKRDEKNKGNYGEKQEIGKIRN